MKASIFAWENIMWVVRTDALVNESPSSAPQYSVWQFEWKNRCTHSIFLWWLANQWKPSFWYAIHTHVTVMYRVSYELHVELFWHFVTASRIGPTRLSTPWFESVWYLTFPGLYVSTKCMRFINAKSFPTMHSWTQWNSEVKLLHHWSLGLNFQGLVMFECVTKQRFFFLGPLFC